MPRKFLSRALLVVAGTLLGLLVLEVGIRMLGLDDITEHESVDKFLKWNRDCKRLASPHGYELVPSSCAANSMGIIDHERSVEREPDELRYVALGDSVTADAAWTLHLEHLLAASQGRPVEVFNLGVPGYTPVNEVALYRARGAEFDPDGVLLQLGLNDYNFTPVLFEQDGTIYSVQANAEDVSRLQLDLFRRSALYRVIWAQLLFREQQPTFEEGAAALESALTELAQMCDDRDTPLLATLVPPLAERGSWPPRDVRAYEHLTALMDELGIPFIDLTGPFERFGSRELRKGRQEGAVQALRAQGLADGYEPQDGGDKSDGTPARERKGDDRADRVHPNDVGHFLIARELSALLTAGR